MMATGPTVETALALVQAMNNRDIRIWEHATSPALAADYPGAHGLNKDAARAYNLAFLNASDDIHFEVENIISDQSYVVVQCSVGATFHHPLVTPDGTIPATGLGGGPPIPFALIAEIQDGMIVRETTLWNQLEVFKMWGILP